MYLIFDIGGTKMRLAVSRDGVTFEPPKIALTPNNEAGLVDEFMRLAKELLTGETPRALAGGITRRYEAAKAAVAKIFPVPSFIDNDTALVGLGEFAAANGAGQGAGIMAYLTVSTGVGGVRIVDGKIDRHAVGFEPGHQFINVRGGLETLEQAIGGRALEARLGRPPAEITDPQVWAELANLLAPGVHNSIVHWSPEVVVLGGQMILGTPGIDWRAAAAELARISNIFPELPAVRVAALGDVGGLHGALEFLRQSYPQWAASGN